ncbi:MAG TPA: CoA transferase, partial [Candidatus Dormibacteraeota bacterium]|nr:CoA transferase [Candidatus Dormibacteraeota bacterium]
MKRSRSEKRCPRRIQTAVLAGSIRGNSRSTTPRLASAPAAARSGIRPALPGTPLSRTRFAVLSRAAMNAAIEARLAGGTTEHWIATLNAAGVPCGRVMGLNEVFADPQVVDQEMVL